MVELCRSLYAADATLARRRCQRATSWFGETMDKLSRMPNPNRTDLEKSASQFFQELRDENDVPRKFHHERFDEDLALNIELSRNRIRELDDQLRANQFEGYVVHIADRLVAGHDVSLGDLSPRERQLALQFAARVARDGQEHFVHLLTSPSQPYVPHDPLFTQQMAGDLPASLVPSPVGAAMRLCEAGPAYLKRKIAQGVGVSQRTELKRALDWLEEQVGSDRRIDQIFKADLRIFRDNLGKLDVRKRGQKLSFAKRLTDKHEHQIKSVTANRYWHSIQGFFAWAEDEGHITGDDPAAGLKLAMKKGQVKKSPEPFDMAELRKFCQSPLYSGYLRLDDQGRADAVMALGNILEQDKSGVERNSFVKPFLENAWPRHMRFRTDDVARGFARLVECSGDNFEGAVEVVLPFLRPVFHLDMITYRIAKEQRRVLPASLVVSLRLPCEYLTRS